MNQISKRPLRVLVVEDEPLIRWSIGETLATAGHTVVEAGDGTSAVRTLSGGTEPFDVVLLDYRLPDSNDLGLLARIRRLLPRSAVLLMTAFGTPEITRGALELGAYGVVDKPFDMQALEPMLLQALASVH
jgi:two-component system nitrogen regulation response regulator GlnG